MKKDIFHYDLPEELIAQTPSEQRTHSRLMQMNRRDGAIEHKYFYDLPEKLNDGDLLVFNNSKVMPARLFATRASGGRLEILVERVLNDREVLAYVRASNTPKSGTAFTLDDDTEAVIAGRKENLFQLRLETEQTSWMKIMEAIGEVPLPGYIERKADTQDEERYQTVYAQHPGSVAAPTAGLHFDDDLLNALRTKNIQTAFVTLHVGAGTFQPLREGDVREHKMHSERYEMIEEVYAKINETRKNGGRVIAVGTTSVRTLETIFAQDNPALSGETDIFIYPGYEFQAIDGMITNFHLPDSTLIALVSAFAGLENTLNAYNTAVAEKYRFYSYGDAMVIT